MIAVKGDNIEEARANSKASSLDELLAVEGFLDLENRLPMRPSRLRRRLSCKSENAERLDLSAVRCQLGTGHI